MYYGTDVYYLFHTGIGSSSTVLGSLCENIYFIFTGYQGKVKVLKLI